MPSRVETVISIPADLFEKAERLSRRLRVTRSQLYTRAVSEYVSRHSVTESYDRVCAELGEKATLDPFVAAAARRVLERSEW